MIAGSIFSDPAIASNHMDTRLNISKEHPGTGGETFRLGWGGGGHKALLLTNSL